MAAVGALELPDSLLQQHGRAWRWWAQGEKSSRLGSDSRGVKDGCLSETTRRMLQSHKRFFGLLTAPWPGQKKRHLEWKKCDLRKTFRVYKGEYICIWALE